MMKNRAIIFVISSLMVGCTGSGNKDYSTKNFSVIKLANGVYACINKSVGKANRFGELNIREYRSQLRRKTVSARS